jgi:type IV secretion system protein TrbL
VLLILFWFFQVGPGPVPPPIQDPSTITGQFENLVPGWVGAVKPYALELFGALALLDLAFFGWSLWKQYQGDITAAIMSTTNRLLLIALFLDVVLNGPDWANRIINDFVTVGKAANGNLDLQPSVILQQGFNIMGNMLTTALKAGIFNDLLTGLSIAFAGLVVLFSFLIVTVEVVLTKVQTFLALGLGVFFLGFGGSTWTRNYVERYFSYAISSGVRLMTLYFLVGVGNQMAVIWNGLANNAPLSQAGVYACWEISAGAVIYGILCWRGPAMAAGMLGGGPNLSHNEVWGAMSAALQAGTTAALLASGVGSGAGAAAAGGGAAAGGASMAAGATAPSAAGGGAAAAGAGAGGGGARGGSQAVAAIGAGGSGSKNGSGGGQNGNGNGPGPEFGGLDS